MKFYTVTTQSKFDYTFSVETEKHGAFMNFDAALNKLKEVVEKFKKEYKEEFKEYSNSEYYEDENDGALTVCEDYETGYWFCGFGFEEHHEEHQICIDEWEVEE